MIKISKDHILSIYNKLYDKAYINFNKKHYFKSLKDISKCAKLAYKFNWIYYDKNLENLLKKNGTKLLKKTHISEQKEENIIWIDSWGLEKRGLTTQYLNAFTSLNKNIFFILINLESFNLNNQNIKLLLSNPNNKILHINPDKEKLNIKLDEILSQIKNFNPSSLFLHITPWATEALILTNAIEGITKYNINLTDHAFWLGKDFVDYNIEFRDYGATVSTEKRGFKKDQLLKIPYYPIINDINPFEGFRFKKDNDEILILTGGSSYKYKGKNGFFFKMADKILSLNNKAKLLIAGFDQDNYIENEISKLDNKNRIYIIGNRKDIDKVFEKCDIYLGSYPFTGGLMSCYAALFSKPIIAYADPSDKNNHLESIINIFTNSFKTCETLKDVLEYSELLLNDTVYRNLEGEKLNKATMSETKFIKILQETLNNHLSKLKFSDEIIDYDEFTTYNFEREMENKNDLIYFLFRLLKFRDFISFPFLSKYIPHLSIIIINKIKNKLKLMY